MQVAILSDIHANREAFEAVLADAAARGAERHVLLGDIVGYGPDPEWCCDRAEAMVADGALCVRGNHDAAAAAGSGEGMGRLAREAIEWTIPRLSASQRAFLGARPLTTAKGEAFYAHASAHDPASWIYVTSGMRAAPSFLATGARVIFCGHTHVPLLISRGFGDTLDVEEFETGLPVPLTRARRWLAVLGAVGQPRDGQPLASYAMFDTERAELSFLRVPYDNAATVAKLRAAGLPEELAQRLLTGE